MVAGCTNDGTFPQVHPIAGLETGGNERVFITRFASDGEALTFSTLIGGAGPADCGAGIAVDTAGNPYAVGSTNDSTTNYGANFPTTPGAFQTGCVNLNQCSNGFDDSFALTLRNTDSDIAMAGSASPNPARPGANLIFKIKAANDGNAAADDVVVTTSVPQGTKFESVGTTVGKCTGPAVGARGSVVCKGFNLAPGAKAIVTLTVRVAASTSLKNITDTTVVNKHATDYDIVNNSVTTVVPLK